MMQEPPIRTRRDVVLVGAGHSHVQVIKKFRMSCPEDVRVTLINDGPTAFYSGMLPAAIAGLYSSEAIQVDLHPLAQWTGTRLIESRVTQIDVHQKKVFLKDRPPISYDLLSLNVGSQTKGSDLVRDLPTVITTRPLSKLMSQMERLDCEVLGRNIRLVVVGGGAAGVELAFAFHSRLQEKCGELSVTLIDENEDILKGYPASVSKCAGDVLKRKKIQTLTGVGIEAITEHSLSLSDKSIIEFDHVIWATGAAAPEFLKEVNVDKDDHGYLKVSSYLQTSDPNVFASGDCICLSGHNLPKAGVYAVREGPILAHNLLAQLRGEPLEKYKPQKEFLSLLMTGDRRAIGSWKGLAFSGSWVWKLKDFIDQKWMKKFDPRVLAPDFYSEDNRVKLDQMVCAGCGSKVGANDLEAGLQDFVSVSHPKVKVGLQNKEDAAVMEVPPGKDLVQSLDVLKSFVDDPYLMGRISVIHALSDLYAMGAEVDTAQVLVTLPYASGTVVRRELSQLMMGVQKEAERLELTVVGGHTTEGPEWTVGLTVNGWVTPQQHFTKGGLQVGDHLVLTKPLGVGTLLVAAMRAQAKSQWMTPLYHMMLQANDKAAKIFKKYSIQAVTDVTGFGLAGHLGEMIRASDCGVSLDVKSLPLLEGAEETLNNKLFSSLAPQNRASAIENFEVRGKNINDFPILFDPQTSGGLLAGIPSDKVDIVLKELKESDYLEAVSIGVVTSQNEVLELVTDNEIRT